MADDKIPGGEKERILDVTGVITQATYRIHQGVPVVYVFGRLDDGASFQIRDRQQRPHFFVPADEDLSRLAPSPSWRSEPSSRTDFHGRGLKKVEVGIPSDAPKVRDQLHAMGVSTYEADVRFAMRYLIDRRIKGGIRIQGDPHPGGQSSLSDWIFFDPVVEPAASVAEPRVLSFDIETDPRTDRLLAIACYGLGLDQVVVVDPDRREMPVGAVGVPSEKDALAWFADQVRRLDVDVLTGWNVIDFDLSFLQKVADRLRFDLRLGRESGRMRIRPAEGYFGSGSANIPGRLVLDGLDLVRGAFMKLDEYSLDAVANTVLGEGKTLGGDGRDKVAEILHTYHNELDRFTEYARTDARLALEIVSSLDLIRLAFARAALTGMTPDRVAASIASFDFLYLSALGERGLCAPSVANPGESRIPQGGGAVFEPEAGIHDNVWVCDFKSLYPSIIRTFNVDPLGYASAEAGAAHLETEDGTRFAREAGILPSMLDRLFPQREEAKARGDGVASQAIKILMNSFYGVLGTPACRFYNPHIANAITSQGRHLLTWSKLWFEARGHRVLYGDTDSVFVRSGKGDIDEALTLGRALIDEFNREMSAYLKTRYDVDSRLELEFEKLYTRLFLAETRGGGQGARKRYAGLKQGETEVEFVGMEVVRRDWTELAKGVQRELITRLFRGEEVVDYLADVVARLRDGALDDQLVYRKGLRKGVETYTTNVPPHVQAVKYAQAHEGLKRPPRVVRYVMTDEGPRLAEGRHRQLDREHYVERQVKPVASPVLEALNLEFEQVVGDDRQIALF